MTWGTPGSAGTAAAAILDPVVNPADDGGSSVQDTQSGAWAMDAVTHQSVKRTGG